MTGEVKFLCKFNFFCGWGGGGWAGGVGVGEGGVARFGVGG